MAALDLLHCNGMQSLCITIANGSNSFVTILARWSLHECSPFGSVKNKTMSTCCFFKKKHSTVLLRQQKTLLLCNPVLFKVCVNPMSCVVPFYSKLERHLLEISPDMSLSTLKLMVSDLFQWPLLSASQVQFFLQDHLLDDKTTLDILCHHKRSQEGVRVYSPSVRERFVVFENRADGEKSVVKVASYQSTADLNTALTDAFRVPVTKHVRLFIDGRALPIRSTVDLLDRIEGQEKTVQVAVEEEPHGAEGAGGRKSKITHRR